MQVDQIWNDIRIIHFIDYEEKFPDLSLKNSWMFVENLEMTFFIKKTQWFKLYKKTSYIHYLWIISDLKKKEKLRRNLIHWLLKKRSLI